MSRIGGEPMLGFTLDVWDYLTFLTLFLAGGSVLAVYLWLAGLPGRIAIARKHPDAEAVQLLGWAGLLPTVYPWVQAFIWAFKPTEVVDVRRWPAAEAQAVELELARLRGVAPPAVGPSGAPGTPSPPASPTAPA
jgi:hypothetical protein